jgi:hypothetical protein
MLNTSNALNKSELWQLFVVTAFPIHVWAIIVILMDISWVAERTHYWDAIGSVGYGLTFTLIESILVFVLLVLIGLVIPKNFWDNKRVTLLGVLFLITTFWAIVGQLYLIIKPSITTEITLFLVSQKHLTWFLYGCLLLVVTPTVLFGSRLAVCSEKFQASFLKTLNRITPLMELYLFLDIVGITIVAIRNFG